MVGWAGAAGAAEAPALADAAERGNKVLVRTLLDARADVNAAQMDGMTALHWAVFHDDVETARLLVRAGANVNAVNRYGVPPLSLAAKNGNAALVALLLEAGGNANVTLAGGETLLMTAARTGSVDAVKALLKGGANPNARERRDQTALMWAAAEGHAPVVQALIDGGADIHARLKSGFTPFFFAVREGHIDVARTMLRAGVDVKEALEPEEEAPQQAVNITRNKRITRSTSALLMAVQNGHFELAVALVEAGADPNDQRTGFTPLHTISWVRKPDTTDRSDLAPIGSGSVTSLQFVRALVERGANVNMRLEKGVPRPPDTASDLGLEGATPFMMASDRADVPLMRLLLELGADPLMPNDDNSTPLMAAAGLGTTAPLEEAGTEAEAVEAVKLLLDRKADINAVNNNGDTAMHGGAYASYPAVVQLLIDRGADPSVWNQKNKYGITPLFIAEGYRGAQLPKLSRPTIDVLTAFMVSKGLPIDGPRPEIKDIYEKPPVVANKP
jgi:ankyrin repeat protein